jgi:hypothetical protein
VAHFQENKNKMRYKCIIIYLLLNISYKAFADTWAPPKIKDYYSQNNKYFVRIFPKKIPEKYWEWKNAKPEDKNRFTIADTTIIPCHGIMYKLTLTGDSLIWRKELLNEIAPVNVFVSNNAFYILTFDNWHAMGHGQNVMVQYNKNGDLVKSYKLKDISPFPIENYPISISSIWWRCDLKFIDEVKFEICFQDENDNVKKRVYNLYKNKFE